MVLGGRVAVGCPPHAACSAGSALSARPGRLLRLRPPQIPGDELAQELRAVALADQRTQLLPVRVGNADDAVRGVGVLRSTDHADSVRTAYALCPLTDLPLHMHDGKVMHMHTPELPGGELGASISASIQHIELIREKEAKLKAAREEAESQVLHRVGTAYHAGDIDERQLLAVFERYRQLGGSGGYMRWNKNVRVTWHQMLKIRLSFTNGPEGTWIGRYPCAAEDPAPRQGTNVVYVLYGTDNEPCYVGSTNNLRVRLKAHARDGKDFVRWQAYRCRDREHAYELEDRLLREHKPYLNRKVGR